MSAALLSQVLLGVGALVGIVISMVAVLLVFERVFVPRGPFRISIADEIVPSFAIETSDTLLSSLRMQSILLASACGGSGTCGLCKIRVTSGGGDALPPERALLSREEVASGWRLACQLKIRGDITVALPGEVATAKELTCRVLSVRDVATFIREIAFAIPEHESLQFDAGSYVQIRVPLYGQLRFDDFDIAPRYRETWRQFGLLDLVANNDAPTTRAYSLANPPSQSNILVLNVRIATPPKSPVNAPPGVGSSYIYSLHPGDQVAISGPFGEFRINESEREMVYVGGGAGMAPLRSQILHLFNTLHTKRKVSYWYGARSRSELFYDDELEALAAEHPNFSFHIALSDPADEDEWAGETGFIHEVLRRCYLAEHEAPREVEVYVCGPPLMLKATVEMATALGVPAKQIWFDDFGS